jgi:beta-glucuronidase
MKRIHHVFWFALLTLVEVAFAAEPNFTVEHLQNAKSRSDYSLNGMWNVIPDPFENGYYNHRYEAKDVDGYFENRRASSPSDLIEYDFSKAQKLSVPGDWNSQDDKLFFYEGTMWYQKAIDITPKKDKRYILHFGAVNYQSIVYVNGKKMGLHEGGFTPFQFDITSVLRDKDNFLVVKVDNRRERTQVPTVNTDWWNYGGITRSVNILELPESYVSDYLVTLAPETSTGLLATFKIAHFYSSSPKHIQLSIPELNISERIKIDKTGKANIRLNSAPKLWSPSNPQLYSINITYNDEIIEDKIGFRTISTQGEDILLNGKPIFLKGISIHEESPFSDRGKRAWTEEDAETLLRWVKDLGGNFARLAHYPHNEAMVRKADEMGILLWSEIPVYWTVLFDNKQVYDNAQTQLDEMIMRDRNRASIIMWSVANETPSTEARNQFLTNLIKRARKLDDSRLITAAMDTQESTENGKAVTDPLVNQVDIIGINNYCGWYYTKPDECGLVKWTSNHNKPFIMSEVGAGALAGHHGSKDQRWTEEYQANVFKHNIEMLKNIKSLRGVTPWILKDFRSPRRPLTGIQDFWNRKGLISEKGQKKQAFYILRDFYSTMPE